MNSPMISKGKAVHTANQQALRGLISNFSPSEIGDEFALALLQIYGRNRAETILQNAISNFDWSKK